MASIAKLFLDGQEMTVLEFDLEMHQDVDAHARISSIVKGGMIHLVVESSDSDEIHQWAASNNMVKDGEITFQRSETANAMRKVTFKNAYCVSIHESYRAMDEMMMTVAFTVAAEEIISNRMTFKNRW